MRSTFLFIAACLLGGLAPAAAEKPSVSAVEFTPRAGLPNFFAKLKAGGDVRVGYLGGSITAAPGWRVKSLKWLQDQYPKAKISEINAAIGGTGSDLGVFRADQDVISNMPDLLFIEFAVNDGGAPPDRIQRAMEGIVRQTWNANPNTDICFIYTLAEAMLPDLQAGKYPRAANSMEAIAGHYGIPSIHFGVEVAKRVAAGTLIFKGQKQAAETARGPMVFSTDGVHPLVETGHEIYQEVLARSLSAMTDTGTAAPHPLIAPFREDHWEKAKIVPITASMLKGKWTQLDPTIPGRAKAFSNRLPELWKADEPGASLEFIFEGILAKAYDVIGPDGCELEVRVDDENPRAVIRFDRHCSYPRLSSFDIFALPTAGRHAVKITLSPAMPDKANLLSPENRLKMEQNPAPYQSAVWHVGSLLIIGDVVD